MADMGTVGRCGLAAGRYEADREIAGAIIRRSDLEKVEGMTMAGYLIKDTTREERQKIDRKSFERIEGKKHA